jgi:hypothetical protein
MSWREAEGCITAVSSGIVDPSPVWKDIPNDAVLRIDIKRRATTIATLGADRVERNV